MSLVDQISSTSEAVKAADVVFSKYVKLRDTNADGYLRCITCGARMSPEEAQCGHFVKRRYSALRYDPLNGWAQCGMCNCVLDGNDGQYEEILKVRLENMWPGENKFEKLMLKKQEHVKINKVALIEIVKFYEEVINKLNLVRKYGAETPIEFWLQ